MFGFTYMVVLFLAEWHFLKCSLLVTSYRNIEYIKISKQKCAFFKIIYWNDGAKEDSVILYPTVVHTCLHSNKKWTPFNSNVFASIYVCVHYTQVSKLNVCWIHFEKSDWLLRWLYTYFNFNNLSCFSMYIRWKWMWKWKPRWM